jgi:hypothetical protein
MLWRGVTRRDVREDLMVKFNRSSAIAVVATAVMASGCLMATPATAGTAVDVYLAATLLGDNEVGTGDKDGAGERGEADALVMDRLRPMAVVGSRLGVADVGHVALVGERQQDRGREQEAEGVPGAAAAGQDGGQAHRRQREGEGDQGFLLGVRDELPCRGQADADRRRAL